MLIHPSHQPEARRALVAVGVLLLAVVLLSALPASFKTGRAHDYLALHTLLETLSLVMAGLVFGVVWSVRREKLARNVVILGCAFLGVAMLDFSHMLSARGMPDFITPSSADKAAWFWLMARLLGASTLLLVAWLPWGTPRARRPVWLWVPVVIALVAALHVLYFSAPADVARFFALSLGSIGVKRWLQDLLIVMYLLAAARLFWHLRRPRHFNAAGLFAATCVLAEGIVLFPSSEVAEGASALVGHIYKVIAYAFLFRAVFVETVRRPYRLLRASREQLRATVDALPDLLFEMDARGRYLDVHTHFRDQLAASDGRLIGKTVHEVLSPADARIAMAALDEAGLQGASRGKVVAVDTSARGRRWFELSVARKPSAPGQDARFVVVSRDITERRNTEHDLLKFSQAVSQSPVAIVITDLAATVEFVNAAFTRITGFTAAEAVGSSIETLLQSDKTPAATIQDMWATIRRGDTWRGELVNVSRSGRDIIESVLIYPIRNADGVVTNYLAHQEDITDRKQAAERIRQLSHYDALTGLPNRAMLYESFRYLSTRGACLALLWMDVDHFKDINDSLGHRQGDRLLQEIGRRLRSVLRAQDLLARHSADAFVVVVPDSDAADAAALAHAMLVAVSQPTRLANQDLFVTASIGIALWPRGSGALEYLLGKAENAMYRAKEAGRNQASFFTNEMQQRASRVVALGSALQQARQRGELHLVYQPQVTLDGGRIVGAEALARWTSPQFGEVPPSEFIPIAEANGVILQLGEWVLETALAQWRLWRDRGMADMTLAVNLSAVQFNQPDLAARILRSLERTGVPPECLELELTEAVAMRVPEVAVRRMDELRQHHIRLAIDDFGTGYSSLSYLKQFRATKLKIDQSFVRDIGSDAGDQAITIAVIRMARGLGMRTIAEGVETVTQLDVLRAQGCDEAQGYHFSRPLPPADFERYVHARVDA